MKVRLAFVLFTILLSSSFAYQAAAEGLLSTSEEQEINAALADASDAFISGAAIRWEVGATYAACKAQCAILWWWEPAVRDICNRGCAVEHAERHDKRRHESAVE